MCIRDSAGGLGDVVPEDEEAGKERDPEQKLFNRRIQAGFLDVLRSESILWCVCFGLKV